MTPDDKFLYKEETHRIIGCAFEVLNTLGNGLLEKPYDNAMVVEFKQRAGNKCRFEPTSPLGEVGLPGPGEG